MDAEHIGNTAPTIFATGARPALFAGLPQQGNNLLAQFTTWHGIDCRVDGFMTDLELRFCGVHALQCSRNLLRRIPRSQERNNLLPESFARDEPLGLSRLVCQFSGALFGT